MESTQIFPEQNEVSNQVSEQHGIISNIDSSGSGINNIEENVRIGDNNIIKESTSNDADKQISDFKKIKWLHFFACLFFLLQTIIYSAVPVDAKAQPTIGVPGNCSGPACYTVLKYLGEANPIFLIPLFVALAFFDHFCCYIGCQFYEETAKFWLFTIGSNPLRWIEYSLSASFMAVAISILCGITDVHLWLLIFIMHGIGMFFGLIMEILPKKERIDDLLSIKFSTIKQICYWLGFVSIFTPWLIMCCYFFRAIDNSVPKFVYAAFLVTLVLFLAFGINSYLHNILQLYNFTTAEIVYISLSFTAKTFLAADVFGGLKASGTSDDD